MRHLDSTTLPGVKRRKDHVLLCGLLLLLGSFALAQTITLTEAARQVQMAVYQANATQEAIKAQMNAQLRERTEAVAKLDGELKALRAQSDGNSKAQQREIEALANELASAQANVERMLETDRSYREQIKIFRNEVTDIANDPERLEALRIYNEGRPSAALSILDQIDAALSQAERKAQDIKEGERERQKAALANSAIGRDGITLAAVITRYETVLALDATTSDWFALTELYEQANRIDDMKRASIEMLALSTGLREKSIAQNQLGSASRLLGDSDAALLAFERSLSYSDELLKLEPESQEAKQTAAVALDLLGLITSERGDTQASAEVAERSLLLRESLLAADPSNAKLERELSMSLDRVGDLRKDQGDSAGMLQYYQRSLDISKRLVAADPDNLEDKRNLTLSLWRVADAYIIQGRYDDALQLYQESFSISSEISEADPTNIRAKREVALVKGRIGAAKLQLGDLSGALKARDEAVKEYESIALQYPGNAQAQEDLAIELDQIAALKFQMGELEAASVDAKRALDINRKILSGDSGNARNQTGVAVSLIRIALIYSGLGQGASATMALEESTAILRGTLENDPSNQWVTRLLGMALMNFSEVLMKNRMNERALEAGLEGKVIFERLSQLDSSSTQARRDLALSIDRIGDVKLSLDDRDGAIKDYTDALNILVQISTTQPSNARILSDMAFMHIDLWQAISDFNARLGHAEEAEKLISAIGPEDSLPGDLKVRWGIVKDWLRHIER